MVTIPKVDELKERYKALMNNKDITDISNWKEPNTDKATNEEEYLNKALGNVDGYVRKMGRVLEKWDQNDDE